MSLLSFKESSPRLCVSFIATQLDPNWLATCFATDPLFHDVSKRTHTAQASIKLLGTSVFVILLCSISSHSSTIVYLGLP